MFILPNKSYKDFNHILILQCGYQDVTAGSGLMGLAGDGKPLLSVADLESRLVFTRCKVNVGLLLLMSYFMFFIRKLRGPILFIFVNMKN